MADGTEAPAEELVRVWIEGRVGHLELCRPEKRNAISRAMAELLLAGLHRLESDETCHAVVLSGRGEVFSSGADMKEPREPGASPQWVDDPGAQLLQAVAASRLPVVSAVDGRAIGLALGLLGGSTYVVAGPDAGFSLPEVHDGYLPHAVMPYLLHRMQPEVAVDWALSGDIRSVDEALEARLVTHAAVDEPATQVAARLAARLAEAPRPQVLQAMELLHRTRRARGTSQVREWCDQQMDLLLQADG